ncbi:hypothetical protein WN55_03208 [Dufourea novaeangliae]|uniref:Uncharacterized protein n=1 Tax=Dufourea novaeangliae TaxID=178035 RepID=A0A154PK05_DUFNO|nr:hypothetical protein WN55_03208 [Dufourea novaeangliae]
MKSRNTLFEHVIHGRVKRCGFRDDIATLRTGTSGSICLLHAVVIARFVAPPGNWNC